MKEFDGADFLVFSEEENPYYNNPDVLQVVDGSNITASAAVINPNRYDIRYIDAIAEFAADKPAEQRAALLAQYGRRPGGATTGDRTFEAATAVLAGVSAGVARRGRAAPAAVGGELQAPLRRGRRGLHARAHARRQAGAARGPVLPGPAQQPAGELAQLPDGLVPDRLRRRPADQRGLQGPALLRADAHAGDDRLPGALPAAPPRAARPTRSPEPRRSASRGAAPEATTRRCPTTRWSTRCTSHELPVDRLGAGPRTPPTCRATRGSCSPTRRSRSAGGRCSTPPCSTGSTRAGTTDQRKRRSRSALATTETLENAIAAPASSGLSRPAAASGSAATL